MADPTGKRKAVSSEDAEEILDPAPTRRRQPSIPRLEVPIEERVTWLEAEVGEEPRHGLGHPGSGLWRAMHELRAEMIKIATALENVVRQLETDRAAKAAAAAEAAKQREPWSRAGWIVFTAVVSPVVAALVAAGIYWLSTLHH